MLRVHVAVADDAIRPAADEIGTEVVRFAALRRRGSVAPAAAAGAEVREDDAGIEALQGGEVLVKAGAAVWLVGMNV